MTGERSAAADQSAVAGPLSPEDAKIVTLARSARLRAHTPRAGLAAAEGAAVRDTDGRTYAAATVENGDPALTTSALRAAVAAAASSGARSFEAAAVVSEALPVADGIPVVADLAVLAEFGSGVPVLLAGPDGVVRERVAT
ncbi:MAG: cytidine deaminase [Frankia sp.]